MQKNKSEEHLEDALEYCKELDSLLTDRISDLFEVKGGIQSRHAYIFYRSYVHKIKRAILNYPKHED